MWPFRYLGQHQRIINLYECFAQAPRQAQHPAELSRESGLPLATVNELLAQHTELFVQVPRRKDGLTRYRLASVLAGQSQAQVEAMIMRSVRSERLTLYTVLFIALSLIAITVVLSFPWAMLMRE